MWCTMLILNTTSFCNRLIKIKGMTVFFGFNDDLETMWIGLHTDHMDDYGSYSMIYMIVVVIMRDIMRVESDLNYIV